MSYCLPSKLCKIVLFKKYIFQKIGYFELNKITK